MTKQEIFIWVAVILSAAGVIDRFFGPRFDGLIWVLGTLLFLSLSMVQW